MHTRKWLALWLGGALTAVAALALAAPPSPKPPPADPGAAAAAVQQFLTARLTNQPQKAYTLLSPASRQQVPLSEYEKGIPLPSARSAEGMSPSLLAVMALFGDVHNQSGYRFHLIGAMPGNPNIVLVRAEPPGARLKDALTLPVVTVADPAAGGAPRLDLMQTAERADPTAVTREREKARQITSVSNLKQIALGIEMYIQDHNERFPDADRWVDEVMPYIKNEKVFHDPSTPDGQKWSYAFNSALSGKSLADVRSPAATVLVFESTTGVKNAADTGASVPHPGRHNGGTDYGFVDGHVKWMSDKAAGEKDSLSFDL